MHQFACEKEVGESERSFSYSRLFVYWTKTKRVKILCANTKYIVQKTVHTICIFYNSQLNSYNNMNISLIKGKTYLWIQESKLFHNYDGETSPLNLSGLYKQ